MNRVFKANLYFLIILILEVFLPFPMTFFYVFFGITDVKLILALNHFVIFIIPAIIYVLISKCNLKETFSLRLLSLKEIFFVIILSVGAIMITNFFGLISNLFFENEIGEFINNINDSPYIILLLLIAVMPAITEEITLRGIVLSGYSQKSEFKAALVSGLFFGIFHLNLNQFVYATVLGFLLAYTVRVTGSIFSSMIIHFLINGTSITLNKLLYIISPELIQNSSNLEVLSYSFGEKMNLILSSTFELAIGVLITIFTIRKLRSIKLDKENKYRFKMNENNNIFELEKERIFTSDYKNFDSSEKIINWPFICTVIFFIIYIIITNFIFK